MTLSKRLAFVLVISTGLLGPVLGGCAAADDDAAEDGSSSEDNFTVDVKKSEALLAKAVSVAEKLKAGKQCDELSDADEGMVAKFTVVALLRQAVAARDTVFFRTKVVAKKAILAEVLAGSLEWQEILGTYNPKKPETLAASLASGVSVWDTNGGAFGNQARIEFRAGGKAVVYTLDTESPDFKWSEKPTTWKLENNNKTLKLGTGESFALEHTGDFLMLTKPGSKFNDFISTESECEA
jgi:hypothetical protein